MLGLPDVWFYKNPKKPRRLYWVFHLKHPCNPDDIHSDWIFYDKEENNWSNLDKEEFDKNKNGVGYKRINYEDLLKDWETVLQRADPPFGLNNIASCQLQVWAWCYSINESKEFAGPEDYNEDDSAGKCPKEKVCWFFHLKNNSWSIYDFCENAWGAIDNKKHLVTDKTCHPVSFDVFEKEWQLRFSKEETRTPFEIADIMTKNDDPPSYQI